MKVTAEFLPLIHTINMYVNAPNPTDFTKIEIEEDGILLRNVSNSSIIRINMDHSLQPDSVSGVYYESDWLSFRLQLKPKANTINSIVSQVIKEIPSLSLDSNEIKLAGRPVQLHCKCGFPLSEKITLKRVCEVPSKDLFSASENWFCHVHKDWREPSLDYRVIPRENECFYDEVSFIVPSSLLSLKAEGEDDTLICTSCFRKVGIIVDKALKIWSNDIKWMDTNEEVFCKSASDIFLSLLFNLEKYSLATTPHLVLEVNKEQFLYVIAVDNHLKLLTTETSDLNDSSCEDFVPPIKQQRMTDDSIISLKKIVCVKVLYKYKSKEDEETKEWINDDKIHTLSCGSSLLKSLLEMLTNSSKCIPGNLREVSSLKVGYIAKSFKNVL